MAESLVDEILERNKYEKPTFSSCIPAKRLTTETLPWPIGHTDSSPKAKAKRDRRYS